MGFRLAFRRLVPFSKSGGGGLRGEYPPWSPILDSVEWSLQVYWSDGLRRNLFVVDIQGIVGYHNDGSHVRMAASDGREGSLLGNRHGVFGFIVLLVRMLWR